MEKKGRKKREEKGEHCFRYHSLHTVRSSSTATPMETMRVEDERQIMREDVTGREK